MFSITLVFASAGKEHWLRDPQKVKLDTMILLFDFDYSVAFIVARLFVFHVLPVKFKPNTRRWFINYPFAVDVWLPVSPNSASGLQSSSEVKNYRLNEWEWVNFINNTSF